MAYAKHIAEQSNQSLDEVLGFWRSKPGYVDMIVQEILERKAFDHMMNLCKKEDQKENTDSSKSQDSQKSMSLTEIVSFIEG
jgi:FKBP-type peptidyl-prolyl cis-trans isomerase (trigger factor)